MKKVFGLSVLADEYWNVITHGIGLLLVIPGAAFLLLRNDWSSLGWVDLGLSLFCFGLLAVYTASTCYHLAIDEDKKQVWRIIDHIAIYFLIGGSYSAYILKYFAGSEGLGFLAIHWIIIGFGVVFKVFYTGKFEFVSTALYLLLGWMVLTIISPLLAAMPASSFYWILAGGISYSIGVVFYLRTKQVINHAIWHVFVLLGSGCHYLGLVI